MRVRYIGKSTKTLKLRKLYQVLDTDWKDQELLFIVDNGTSLECVSSQLVTIPVEHRLEIVELMRLMLPSYSKVA